MRFAQRTFACLATSALFLTACHSKTAATPENYTATMNAYFIEHPDCLLDGTVKFPFETGEAELTRQMDALTTAKMLEGHKATIIHITRYTLTDAGTRAGKNFCYGHREVTSIDASTPPALANGFKETQVDYHYKVADIPVWAKTPEVVAAFPKMAQDASGNASGRITLALTGVGWSVPE